LLLDLGLQDDHYLIDVGCGSGRLAKQLSANHRGHYLGLDIVPQMIDYARKLVARPDWRFEVTNSFTIPEEDGRADFVCFFSVFTHLLHEESFVYLREARRVLKPKGRIVFSFLEFCSSAHLEIFKSMVAQAGNNQNPLNMFVSRDGIEAWAKMLDIRIVEIRDGEAWHIPLREPVVFSRGEVMEKRGRLGQSVCVLEA
jgi:ubiquinone/menaquinone biosynthesis C-methylase UbiE